MVPRRYACPCCGALALSEQPPGTHEICRSCGWEDDDLQFHQPDFRGGANIESLDEARARWRRGTKAGRRRRRGTRAGPAAPKPTDDEDAGVLPAPGEALWVAADSEAAAAGVAEWLRVRSFHVNGVVWLADDPAPHRCGTLSVRASGPASGGERAVLASRPRRADHLLRLQDEGWGIAGVVDPSARVAASSRVNPSCLIGPQATVGGDASLWSAVLVDEGAQVGAGTIIEDAVVVAAGADVGSGARICAGSHIGENASVADGAFVPPHTVIGAGSAFPVMQSRED